MGHLSFCWQGMRVTTREVLSPVEGCGGLMGLLLLWNLAVRPHLKHPLRAAQILYI